MQDDTGSQNKSPKPLPDDETLRQLAAEVKLLSAQISELQSKVAQLEGSPAPIVVSPPMMAPGANTGLKLLNRAGAVTLFLGIIFFFKYAVDNEWIGAAGRVLLGVVAGFALLGGGEWLRTRGQTVFAQGVSACGIATIYISIYAAADYYKLIAPTAAFVAFIAISAGAIGLSLRRSDAVLSVTGYLCAVIAPGLWHAMEPTFWAPNVWAWFGFVYLLAVQASAIRQMKAPVVVPIVAAAIGLEAFYLINPRHPIVCVVFFLALAAVYFGIRSEPGYVLGHVAVLVAGARLLFFWFQSSGLNEAVSLFLGVYGIAMLTAAVTRKSASDRVFGLALLGAVIGKLYVADVWLLTRFYRITAFVVLGVLLLASSFVYSRWRQRGSA